MFGIIILLCFPLLVLAAGKMSSGSRKNALFCAVFAFIVFFFAASGCLFGTGPQGADGTHLRMLFENADSILFNDIGSINCPPGYMFLIKIFSLAGADANVFVMFIAGLCSLSAALFIYRGCSSSCEGAYIFSVGAMVTAYISLSAFMALTICAHAFCCIRDRRFFRAAAFAALAACFDTSALITALYYFTQLIPNIYISLAVCVAGSTAFAFIPGMTDAVFSIFGAGTYCVHNTQMLCASFAAAGAALALIMIPMLKNRDADLIGNIPLLCGGTALMFAAAADGRLFVPAILLTAPAAVILAPDIHIISVKFTQILFPEKSGKAGFAVTAAFAALAFVPYLYMILTGCCGTGAFGLSLFGEA